MGYTLITGATSDIGRQICRTLENSGHLLLLIDKDELALIETVNELEYSKKHLYIQLDLSNTIDSISRLTDFIKCNDISIGYAVYAAGIFTIKPIKLIDYDFLKLNFNIAVFSAIMISQILASKKYNASNLKSIVFLSSISARIGTKGYVTYSAVKSSMIGAMKSMAIELSPRVRVNAVLPGGILTRATNFLRETMEDNPRYVLGCGDKADVANLVDFLLSDKSRWITGQEFVVDGGLSSN
jgi:NAD(P)-dependent dehydrogenase (short-subunit alcohol dehydrogenase family)